MFFFANSYVNDFIPGKNQGTSTVPANERHLHGDFHFHEGTAAAILEALKGVAPAPATDVWEGKHPGIE